MFGEELSATTKIFGLELDDGRFEFDDNRAARIRNRLIGGDDLNVRRRIIGDDKNFRT